MDKSKQLQPVRLNKGELKETEVEVVCRSPNSEEVFTTVVDRSAEAHLAANREDCTSENSAIVRAEVRDIVEGQCGEQEASAEEDRRRFKNEVRQAMRNQRGVYTEAERNDDKEEKTRRENRKGKRQRSRTRRSRSNLHDR